MAADTKEMIARAAQKLLLEKKKLTVKDIVDECHITRQSFYYHFEDVPHLLEWILEQGFSRIREEGRQKSDEEYLKYLIMVSLNLRPYIDKTMKSSYADELELLIRRNVYTLFEQIAEERGFLKDSNRNEWKLALRYHSHALLGVIHDWSDEDTKNVDEVVHTLYIMLDSGMKPLREAADASGAATHN